MYFPTYVTKFLYIRRQIIYSGPMAKEHQGASLPKELLRRIDYIVKETDLGYTSRADFVKEAVRQKLDEVERKLLELEKLKKELKER